MNNLENKGIFDEFASYASYAKYNERKILNYTHGTSK